MRRRHPLPPTSVLTATTYPGDENLQLLRETFSYAGFWLNPPPGEKTNTWSGKRQPLQSAGFGFLVLFNGRLYTALKTLPNAAKLGKSDAQTAIASARREGFPSGAIIFLDQEEGGRMLPEQKAYIYAWVDGVAAGGFRAGIYCSGIAAMEDGGVVTAEDVRQNAAGRKIAYWVANDACPPSPGCAFPKRPPSPGRERHRPSPTGGNLLNLQSGGTWRLGVRPTTTVTEVAIRRESISTGTCTWI